MIFAYHNRMQGLVLVSFSQGHLHTKYFMRFFRPENIEIGILLLAHIFLFLSLGSAFCELLTLPWECPFVR